MASATGNRDSHIPVTFRTDLRSLPQHVRDAFRYLYEACGEIDKLYLFSRGQDLAAQQGIFDNTKPLAVWPMDLSQHELKEYLAHHPEESEAILSPFAVVSRDQAGKFSMAPYSVAYKDFLEPAATLIEKAAYLLGEYPKFQHFLKARAQSFRDGNFLASDREWVHATDAPIELILGPMECYEDTLRNIKREFEGILMLVPPEAERELARFQESVRPYDEMLGLHYGYHPKSVLTPMRVVDVVALAGEARYRYITMACNLPNDPEILQDVGSKKTFFRQVIESKLKELVMPIMERVFDERSRPTPSGENYLHRTLGHELSHGLTFRFNGEDFGELAMPLEESKADVFGNLFLYFLEKRGVVRHGDADHGALVHIADLIRQVRFGLEEAHAMGALMQWNWLEHEGVIEVKEGKLLVAEKLLEEAYQALGDAFYKLAAGKSETEARTFVKNWSTVTTSLRTLTALVTDVPVDIDPQIELCWE